MAENIYKEIAEQIPALKKQLEDAKGFLQALAEAGEDTAELRQELRSLEVRLNRWELMLKRRKAL